MSDENIINNQKLFGTDGIRGIAGKFPLTKEFINKIGLSASIVLKKYFQTNRIFIGWDTRESSFWISNILLKTFQSVGYEVYSLGIFPTSGIAFLSKKHSAIGIVISASHNPYQFNGIKFFNNYGIKLEDEYEEEIEKIISSNLNVKFTNKKIDIINFCQQAEGEYIEFLSSVFRNCDTKIKEKMFKLSLVIDCANGSTYRIGQKVFKLLFPNCKFININPSGKNINKNCGALYPENVVKHIRSESVGISFDGDGDRVIFVDERKNIRDGDYILGILAQEYKKQKLLSNSFVIPTVMSNLGLLKFLWSKGIRTVLAPVGDKNVYEYMKNYKSILGGEQSGHIILWKYLQTGDGILTALEVLRVMLENNKKLYEMCNIFDKYPQMIKNVKVKEKLPLEKIFPEKMLKRYEKQIEGRIFIRYSGTEPLLRIMVEGKTNSGVKKIAEILEKHYQKTLKENK